MLCERASHQGPPFYSWNSLFYSETYSDFLVGLKKNSNNKTPHKRERLGRSGISLGCEEAGGERRKALETGWGGRSPHSQPLGN